MSDFQENSAGYLANHMARLFAAGLQKRIQPLGVAPAQFMVLLELWTRDGRTQADLVGALDVEQATMANTLNRMQRDGLIERRASDTDRRSRLVFLTDRARGLEAEAKAAARAQNAQALAGIDEADRARFLALMRRAIANMQRG
ncbi:MarR family winged helix-turn-helix transcriptional regulator [Ruegeria sp. HKCCD8929]|uniref:MarR family winged helix-turn-helix transcriptional regulator n=1 Tax=Ruegeria sp. HKCCD8929 TaxID=2683006 RepID=UPI0014891B4B|nr:MarR family transcriptional regulator [Ruegeria sp. HKCCD8929]